MDGDVDGSSTLVLYLDHLLIAVTLRHTHKTCKTADTVVDMHHVIARFKLLDFLQRQGHLTRAGLVGAEVVLMEAVENLMVGKDAYHQVIVDKSLVERLFHRREHRLR